MKLIKNKLFPKRFIYIGFLYCSMIASCSMSNPKGQNDVAECRLYWLTDSQDCVRLIGLNYLMINNTDHNIYLPIKLSYSEKRNFCSTLKAYVENKEVVSFVYYNDECFTSILKPNDSIRIKVKIPGWALDSANIDKKNNIFNLVRNIRLEYEKCLSDTFYSKLKIADILFTKNESVFLLNNNNNRERIF